MLKRGKFSKLNLLTPAHPAVNAGLPVQYADKSFGFWCSGNIGDQIVDRFWRIVDLGRKQVLAPVHVVDLSKVTLIERCPWI